MSRKQEETQSRTGFLNTLLTPAWEIDRATLLISLERWASYVEKEIRTGDCVKNMEILLRHLGFSHPPSEPELYQLLRTILDLMHGQQQSLVTGDKLVVGVCESRGCPMVSSAELDAARQAVFCMLGCLTLLFSWRVPPKASELAIEGCTRTQSLNSAAQRSVGKLLNSFGQDWRSSEPGDGLLVSSNLDFFTLFVVAKLEMELVHDIGSHLSLNPITRKLCVFAFPAYCALWCNPSADRGILDGIIAELFPENSPDTLRLYFQEVLLSFRILFAYNKRSRRLFFDLYNGKDGQEVDAFCNKLLAPPHSHTLESLPADLWPPSVRDGRGFVMDQAEFDMSCDFTILGRRLDKLQQYCLKHNPRKIRDMWYDRRNKQQWVTFWAAIIIGGTSIVLSFGQLILAGLQLRAAG